MEEVNIFDGKNKYGFALFTIFQTYVLEHELSITCWGIFVCVDMDNTAQNQARFHHSNCFT